MRWAFRFGSVASGLLWASLAWSQPTGDPEFARLRALHRQCAEDLTWKMVRSGEPAETVARAALAGCAMEKQALRSYLQASMRSRDGAERVVEYHEKKVFDDLVLIVVAAKSGQPPASAAIGQGPRREM